MCLRCSATEAKASPQRLHDVAFEVLPSFASESSVDSFFGDDVWGGDCGTGPSDWFLSVRVERISVGRSNTEDISKTCEAMRRRLLP